MHGIGGKGMRILSVTAQKPDGTGSGVYLTELVKGLDKLGHTQAVVAGVTKEDAIILPQSVQCYPVYYKTEELPFPVCGMSDEMPYESTRYCDMTESMTVQFEQAFKEKICAVVEAFSPDVILCHHLYYLTSLIRAQFPDKKIYGFCHGSDMRQIKKNPWQRDFVRNQIPKLDTIFALHNEQKKEICDYYGCPEEKVTVIGTGYNGNVFYRRNELKEEHDELRLVFVGKISEKKGVKSLLRSMKHMGDYEKNVELSLIGGSGNEREYKEIQSIAKQCDCKVHFCGRVSQDELVSTLNKGDVFVLPSFYEGLPLVIIEALACGLNVVCTDLSGIKDWLSFALPEHEVVFVKPPQFYNQDEPVEETLPDFEKRLAEAICLAKNNRVPEAEQIQRLSWDGLCKRVEKTVSQK